MFVRAIEQAVRESDALDWKALLPGKTEPLREEYAKDVAAMANSRGGLIVYGMAEERGTSAAREIRPVEIGEGARQQLAAIAATNIHPFVAGVQLLAIDAPDESNAGLLVVSVPQSIDAPHLVGQRESFRVPFRDGADTRWMSERDLERAYRDRFGRRIDEHARLQEEVDEVAERLDDDSDMWLIGVAMPRIGLPSAVTAPMTREVAVTILADALAAAYELLPSGMGRTEVLRALNDAALNPRVGLRRWIAHPIAGDTFTHVELHHDGAVSLSARADGWYETNAPGGNTLPVAHIETFCAELVSLVDTLARQVGVEARYAVRVDLAGRDSTTPIYAVDQQSGRLLLPAPEVPPWSRPVRRFHPAYTEVEVPAERDQQTDAARQLGTDVLAQFGISQLRLLN